MGAPRVLFVHGLEGHPNGTKVRALRAAGLEVHAADMHMSLWGLRKKNSVARHMLRLPEPWLAAGAAFAGLAWSARHRSFLRASATVGLAAGWFAVRRRAVVGAAMARSLDACLDVQREALETFRPHVLVGSSWGGAVAMELLLEEAWTGPTVLLAPAFATVRRATGRGIGDGESRLRALAERSPITIVHDPTDDVVKHHDSLRLAAGSSIDLRSIDGGGHRLLDYVDRGDLDAEIRRLAG